ncbi:MAG: tryptophan synthase alpha chain [Planctomycetota bacterium]|jgi:tryptophan synthase alpha chain
MNSNRLVSQLQEMQRRGRKGVAPYITAGDGGLETTLAVLEALDSGGACCVELGVPFSDPIADGPVLQAAASRALEAGTNLRAILKMVAEFRSRGGKIPIALFSYANPLLRLSWEEAARLSAEAGVDAWLIPDMIPEESTELLSATAKHSLAQVFFVAPTSSPKRIERAAQASQGFLYAIGRVGVTGAETELAESTLEFLKSMRQTCHLPLAVGFGLRNAAQVAAVTQHADIAIIGSAFVERIHNAFVKAGNSPKKAAEEATLYLSELMEGLNQ